MRQDAPKLSRREWEALGKLLLPVRMGGSTKLGPKTAIKMAALGLVEYYNEPVPPLPSDPPWFRNRLRMTGYRMTPRGQLLYCEWADAQETAKETATDERSQKGHDAAEAHPEPNRDDTGYDG